MYSCFLPREQARSPGSEETGRCVMLVFALRVDSACDFNIIIFIFVFDLLCILLSMRLCKATRLLQAPTEPGLVESSASKARRRGKSTEERGRQKKVNARLLLGCKGCVCVGKLLYPTSELICRTKLQKSLFMYDSHSRISAPLQVGGEGAECHP